MRLEPNCILGAKAYIAVAYDDGFVIASSPAKALEEYARASFVVREAWSADEWVNGWCLAMVHLVRRNCGDYAKEEAP